MFIEINPHDETPIYTQLMYQIKKNIVLYGDSLEKDLPSVRSLASDLGINMHTVNKAYNRLVEEGVLSKSKRGYFIQEQSSLIQHENVKEAMLEKLTQIQIDADIYGVSEQTISEWLESIKIQMKEEVEK
ncbi:GntR family transcriptional regulator [Desemzia sp. RIT804]|uniref:GntR family transcriptional regulator n=1 Tax=Desemzia sp. RIT 804 TaxID=2810209 RepID=UPI00194E6A53|nr:GntR family transcriptional regulator [Desemzia sp. RIT 804]MBM6614626.1 GntR family transcriptional regulator [Desemzia sp. RIT 804]